MTRRSAPAGAPGAGMSQSYAPEMWRQRIVLLTVLTAPPLMLAGVGLAHPMHLTADSARSWRDLHVLLLPIFPLLGVAPWLVVRRESAVLGAVAAVLGYVYATFYTALDVLAGIGAGSLEQAGIDGGRSVLFAQADSLVRYGVWAYLAATILAAAVVFWRAGVAALPGSVLIIGGAWSFLDSHIFWPRGVLTMLALAIGWAALAWPLPLNEPIGANSSRVNPG
jgi:hypothetical protein